MKNAVITIIRQNGKVEDVDRDTLSELLVGLPFFKLPCVLFASIIKRTLFIVVFVEQLHLDVNKLTFGRLGLDVEDRLFIAR